MLISVSVSKKRDSPSRKLAPSPLIPCTGLIGGFPRQESSSSWSLGPPFKNACNLECSEMALSVSPRTTPLPPEVTRLTLPKGLQHKQLGATPLRPAPGTMKNAVPRRCSKLRAAIPWTPKSVAAVTPLLLLLLIVLLLLPTSLVSIVVSGTRTAPKPRKKRRQFAPIQNDPPAPST